EFNYRVVAKVLGKEEPESGRKSHIYIFDRMEDWQEFQKAGALEPWSGGIHSAGSLFVRRDPSYKFSGHSLGHEIAHLLIYRSYCHRIPTWLNEGFAEYVSRNSRASYQRARHYLAKPHSNSLAPEQVIPLSELVTFTAPPNDRVDLFYDESERLVRFLAQADRARFLAFLETIAKGEAFTPALLHSYVGVFANSADFEAKFRAYASEDFGTSLQDQE
ncbi:MAG: peptidase MA family metallohydrolase, partial [Chthoniobacterales bacterium]